jgi:NitT/TauT family transport system substrate-binding protein
MRKDYWVKIEKICFSLSMVIALLMLVTACTGAAPTPAPERPPLKVSWNLWPGYYPMVIAQELELFEKHGVKVESIVTDSYATLAPDFIAHKTDGVLFTWPDALVVDTRAPDSARLVLVVDESAGADIVVATPDIASATDLKGKRIGASLGSFGELLVRHMLQESSLTLDDVTMVNVGPETVPEAMPDSIQAGFTFEPHASQAMAKGNHILYTSAQAPGLITDVLIFRTEVIQQRPEDIRAFIAAWFEAVTYWQENPTEGNAIIAKTLDLNIEEISIEGLKLLNREDNLHAFTPGPDTTSLYVSGKVNADFLISSGGLSTAPDMERLLDPSFLK